MSILDNTPNLIHSCLCIKSAYENKLPGKGKVLSSMPGLPSLPTHQKRNQLSKLHSLDFCLDSTQIDDW